MILLPFMILLQRMQLITLTKKYSANKLSEVSSFKNSTIDFISYSKNLHCILSSNALSIAVFNESYVISTTKKWANLIVSPPILNTFLGTDFKYTSKTDVYYLNITYPDALH